MGGAASAADGTAPPGAAPGGKSADDGECAGTSGSGADALNRVLQPSQLEAVHSMPPPVIGASTAARLRLSRPTQSSLGVMPGAAQPSLEMLAAPMLNNGAMPPGIRCEPKRSVTVLSSQQTGGGAPQLVLHGTETGLPPKQVCYLLIDTTGDGQMDALLSDSDGDGRADTLVLDTNGDGVADTAIPCVVIDTTGDGKADVLIVDTTNDGQADTIIRIFAARIPGPVPPVASSAPAPPVPPAPVAKPAPPAPSCVSAMAPTAAVRTTATPFHSSSQTVSAMPMAVATTLGPVACCPCPVAGVAMCASAQGAHVSAQAASAAPQSRPGVSAAARAATCANGANSAVMVSFDEEDVFNIMEGHGSAPPPTFGGVHAPVDATSACPVACAYTAPTLPAPIPAAGSGAVGGGVSTGAAVAALAAHPDWSRGKATKGDGLQKQGWTPEEDATIVRMVQLTGQKWSFIACALPGRTDDAVRNRYLRLQKKKNVVTTDRTTVTSADLVDCQTAKKGDMWTPHEDQKIMEGVQIHGFKWQMIAASLPGRSANAVRNRYLRCGPLDGTSSSPSMATRPDAGGETVELTDPTIQTSGVPIVNEDLAGAGNQGLSFFWDAASLYGEALGDFQDDLFDASTLDEAGSQSK